MQSLCTLRSHCRQWPRNTRYQADATPYLGRTFTGWIAPACGWRTYSISSSARASKDWGTSSPAPWRSEVDHKFILGRRFAGIVEAVLFFKLVEYAAFFIGFGSLTLRR